MACFGFLRRSPELAASVKDKVLFECDLQLTSSRNPKRAVPRHCWLLGDRLVLFEKAPGPKAAIVPSEVIEFAQVASLIGREGSGDYVRLDETTGAWWELLWELRAQSDEKQMPLAKRLAQRFDAFRACRRASVLGADVKSRRQSLTRRGSLISNVTPRRLTLLGAQKVADPIALDKPSLLTRVARILPCVSLASEGLSTKVSKRRTPYRGKFEPRGDLVDAMEFERFKSQDLEDWEGWNWSREAVEFIMKIQDLPEDVAFDFTISVRRGIPDGLKRIMWPVAAGAGSAFSAGSCEHAYELILNRSFGEYVPEKFVGPAPTFSGQLTPDSNDQNGPQFARIVTPSEPELSYVVPHLALLSPAGRTALQRLLWCICLTHAEVVLAPLLPNLLTVLLVFFQEAEAMTIVDRLLQHTACDATHPSVVTTVDMLNHQVKLFMLAARAQGAVPDVIRHLEMLKVDVPAIVSSILQNGLAHVLPFRALCRVYGSLIAEGSVVVLRYALATFKLGASAILKCQTAEDAEKTCKSLGHFLNLESPQSLDQLTKAAYLAKFGSKTKRRMSTTFVIDSSRHVPCIFCRPRLSPQNHGKCPDELWEAIWPWVPERWRSMDPQLIFTTSEDGRSIRTIIEKCKDSDAPIIFLAYSLHGDIVGGLSPAGWKRTQNYVKISELCSPPSDAFVFRMSGESPPEIFPWSGHNQMLFFASELKGLGFGGENVAISIDKELRYVNTAASATFECPSLLRQHGMSGDSSAELGRFEMFALL